MMTSQRSSYNGMIRIGMHTGSCLVSLL